MRDLSRSQIDSIIAILVVAGIIFLDRVTKIFFTDLLSVNESLPIFANILRMTLVHNTGIAFGLFRNQGLVFFVIPFIALVLLIFNIFYYKNNGDLSRMYIVGFSLILSGAIGNLVDRIMYGYVIDFIDFRIWPVFNIADCAITIGAVIVGIKCILLSAK
jgi:signal peptidase II